ncbi:hypothetical protein [Mesobacillus foraminis]|uniref:hypothetical protein n=1 Tax=Mesobacillus foraminis TaxID=279826 RepID=UPI0013CE97A0|nr:hypothetical protein [Mesobacillus foraminis]
MDSGWRERFRKQKIAKDLKPAVNEVMQTRLTVTALWSREEGDEVWMRPQAY